MGHARLERCDFITGKHHRGFLHVAEAAHVVGQKIGIGTDGPVASRTDTTAGDRATRDAASLGGQGYQCVQTNYDTHVRYATLDMWAKFPDFQLRLSRAIQQQCALDRIMIGFNGTSVAANTNRAVKGAMLPEYDAYVDGVLQARPGTQDDVLATVMVWHIDAGNYARALEIAEYALASGIKPPDQYNRNLPTIVQDEVAEAILAGKLSGADALLVAAKAMALTDQADTPDQAKSKLYKAAGWAVLGKTGSHDVDMATRPLKACKEALPLLQRAMELDTRAGVKKDIERLERRLKPKTAEKA